MLEGEAVYPPRMAGPPDEGRRKPQPYYHQRDELSVEEVCILWGQRVVVPPQGRTILLDELYLGHSRICRMKALARSIRSWKFGSRVAMSAFRTNINLQRHRSTSGSFLDDHGPDCISIMQDQCRVR